MSKMLKWFVIGLAVFIMLGFVGGCNSTTPKKQDTVEKAPETVPVESVPEEVTSVDEPVYTEPTQETPVFVEDGEIILFNITRVIDGDTVELADGRKVRYIGIDTPETVHPSKPIECFGKEASAKNKELVEGKSVRLERDVSETDKYGRFLRYVWVGDIFVNDFLVRQGYAISSSYPPDIKYQEQFRDAEREARENNRGLWGSCPSDIEPTPEPSNGTTYTCDCSKTCSEMANCEEAYFQLNECGCSKRDRDKDGIPCESICP